MEDPRTGKEIALGFYSGPVTERCFDLRLKGWGPSNDLTIWKVKATGKIYAEVPWRRNGEPLYKEVDPSKVTPKELISSFFKVAGTFTGTGHLKRKPDEEIHKVDISDLLEKPLDELLAAPLHPPLMLEKH